MMIPNLIYFKSASGNNDFSFKNKKLETMENIVNIEKQERTNTNI